jgi:hypothetical protein
MQHLEAALPLVKEILVVMEMLLSALRDHLAAVVVEQEAQVQMALLELEEVAALLLLSLV